MTTPSFSVVMCTFNSERYVRESIDSVLCQTFVDFELIVVDDGSVDATHSILRSYADDRLRLIVLPVNRGLLQARSFGFEMAKGKYIALMDSDDLCEPDRLQCQFQILESGNVDVCGAQHRTLYCETGKLTYKKSHCRSNDIRALLIAYSPLCNPSVSFRRDLLLKANYRLEYEHAEDYGLWTDFSILGARFSNAEKVLLTYRVHGSQVSVRKKELATRAFLLARSRYCEWLGISGDVCPQPMPWPKRLKAARTVFSRLDTEIGLMSISACSEIYRQFQIRTNVFSSLVIRIERAIFVAFWKLGFGRVE